MAEYRRGANAVCDIKYHVIWMAKYRYKVLRGRVAERARELIRQICHERDVVIVRAAVSPDHIHILAAAPPQLSTAKLVQYVKGRSSRRLPALLSKLTWTGPELRVQVVDSTRHAAPTRKAGSRWPQMLSKMSRRFERPWGKRLGGRKARLKGISQTGGPSCSRERANCTAEVSFPRS